MYVFIHRKDLRTYDLRAFDALHRRGLPGIHLLILDPQLLTAERLVAHSGQQFLEHAVLLEHAYAQAGQTLHLLWGQPSAVAAAVMDAYPVQGLVAHADYTPYARQRDAALTQAATIRSIPAVFLDDLPLAPLSQLQDYAGRSEPYKVFTPFYRKWSSFMQQHYPGRARITVKQLHTVAELEASVLEAFGLPAPIQAACSAARQRVMAGGRTVCSGAQALQSFIHERLHRYDQSRDAFAEPGTSGISRYVNSGALSVREAYEAASLQPGGEAWIRQLAWRDFYLYQAIHNERFFTLEQQYDFSALQETHFAAWSQGRTGIPIIDAAMAQLNQTGEMPNRLRMVTAMFLTKNLLCPFTLGEQYFRLQLSDYDHILNRGGWLWSSSLGYDAAPYFRIMNPSSQSAAHDPHGHYIRRWLPELGHLSDREIHLPRPEAIVDLKASRARAMEVYRFMLQ